MRTSSKPLKLVRWVWAVVFAGLALRGVSAWADPASEPRWPKELTQAQATFTLYEPQVDSWDGYKLKAHSAAAVAPHGEDSRTYGVLWMDARTDVDKSSRRVTLRHVKIIQVSFPSSPGQAEDWAALLQKAEASEPLTLSLDQLESSLAAQPAAKQPKEVRVRNEPPRILFSQEPALLLYIDGKPIFRQVPGTSVERIVNTRPFIGRTSNGTLYLKVFDGWLKAPTLEGPWSVPSSAVPHDVTAALGKAVEQKSVDLLQGGDPEQPSTQPSLQSGPPPRIYVATEPTELVVTDGPPNFAPIDRTNLLYVTNTTGHIFKLTTDQKTYVLLSGRWFRAPSEKGPWEFVPPNKLPEDFASIPDESSQENIKASVAGTPQAKEALIANEIPQTATVNVHDTQMATPTFDGEPQLAPIAGTPLQYVVNSQTPIVMVSPSSFFAVQNGVWFTGPSVFGPWSVATSVPAVLYTIPPSSPLHYLTYVRLYDSTPDEVVYGYTPGYLGTVVSDGVVVYGTGYWYRPWIGTYWWGPPITYGLGCSLGFTPWNGWAYGFGFGWRWGAVTFATGWGWWGPQPWWGPLGFGWRSYYPWTWHGARPVWVPPPARAVWVPTGWANGNVYHRWSPTAVVHPPPGHPVWADRRWQNQVGRSYNSRTGVIGPGQHAPVHNVFSQMHIPPPHGGGRVSPVLPMATHPGPSSTPGTWPSGSPGSPSRGWPSSPTPPAISHGGPPAPGFQGGGGYHHHGGSSVPMGGSPSAGYPGAHRSWGGGHPAAGGHPVGPHPMGGGHPAGSVQGPSGGPPPSAGGHPGGGFPGAAPPGGGFAGGGHPGGGHPGGGVSGGGHPTGGGHPSGGGGHPSGGGHPGGGGGHR